MIHPSHLWPSNVRKCVLCGCDALDPLAQLECEAGDIVEIDWSALIEKSSRNEE